MSDFTYTQQERLSRRQVAERLIDIAYALTAGDPLELNIAGRRIKVPVTGELDLVRELNVEDGQVGLELDLSWASTPS